MVLQLQENVGSTGSSQCGVSGKFVLPHTEGSKQLCSKGPHRLGGEARANQDRRRAVQAVTLVPCDLIVPGHFLNNPKDTSAQGYSFLSKQIQSIYLDVGCFEDQTKNKCNI